MKRVHRGTQMLEKLEQMRETLKEEEEGSRRLQIRKGRLHGEIDGRGAERR